MAWLASRESFSEYKKFMKIRNVCAIATVCAAVLVPAAFAQNDPELNPVLSRLQSLSHGTYTQAEWDAAMQELDAIDEKAASMGHLDVVVQSRAIKAMALADMKRDLRGALRVLEETKRQYGSQKIPSMKRVFIQEADYYGRIGDAEGVRRVIEEFRQNPNFDPEQYPVELYAGRNTPMSVTRPAAEGGDSASITAMEVARERTRFAPGNLFPDLHWTDANGQSSSLQALRGKVVLVDFWHQAWTPWVRDLPNLQQTYSTYRKLGFEIIGVALDRNGTAARTFAGEKRMTWPLVYGETDLPRQLSLFGESSNFLIDQNGIILARNVRGSDLPQLLQKALGVR